MKKYSQQNLSKVVGLLSDHEYHDGSSLGKELKITRTAVWKIIAKLKKYGISLTSVKGKGYLLAKPLILLNEKKIKTELKDKSIDLTILEKVNSTNDYLKKNNSKTKKISVCIAEMQTQGKGRLNRHWYSPFGENIYFSILYPFNKDVSELSGLSLIVSLAVCKVIEDVLNFKENKILVKWPNDIFVDSCKLAGSLIEIQAESHGFSRAIIGIGINVNMQNVGKENINRLWTSLFKITNKYQDRNYFCTMLINYLLDYLQLLSRDGFKSFIAQWKKRDYLFNQKITIISGVNKYNGICVGIDERGFLQLQTESKNILTFSSGETTILK
jgi:BirA family biotin operon repressor/biotin-[acetyl-CoA-carboxylase] ligase